MEQDNLTTRNDSQENFTTGEHPQAYIYEIKRSVTVASNVCCIIVAICIIVLLTNRDVLKDRTKWPLLNYAIASVAFAINTILHVLVLRTMSMDMGLCSFVYILNDLVTVARGLALAFVVIDLTDWLANTKRHQQRMQKRVYFCVIGILWLVGLLAGLGHLIAVWVGSIRCGSMYDVSYNLLMPILFLVNLLLPIIAGCFYRKWRDDEQIDDDSLDRHTPKEALTVVCVLCLGFLAMMISLTIPGFGFWITSLLFIYDGIALLVCILVFHQLRQVCCCKN